MRGCGRGGVTLTAGSGGAGSSYCRTAHQTMPNSMKMGIFSRNISQMKPQVTEANRTYARNCAGAASRRVMASNAATRSATSSPVSVCRRSVPKASTLKDASAVP